MSGRGPFGRNLNPAVTEQQIHSGIRKAGAMDSLLVMALSNAVIAGFMAVIVYGISRVVHRPALIHCLWLVVLLKLVTPPIVPIPIEVSWMETPADKRTESKPAPSTLAAADAVDVSQLNLGHRFAALPVQGFMEGGVADPDGGMMDDLDLPLEGPAMLPEPKAKPLPPGVTKNKPAMVDRMSFASTEPRLIPAEPSEVQLPVVAAPERQPAAELAAASVPANPVENPSTWTRRDLLAGGVAIWLAGSIFYAMVWLIRVYCFRHLLKQATPAPAELQAEVAELAARWGMRQVPEVLLLPGAVSPMLWSAGLRPCVIFPRELLGRMDACSRSTLLLHELAHMHRGDHWVRYIEMLASCLYWWNPVLWWARREIHLAEEQCCDALVVEQTGDGGRTYATALLDTIDFLADAKPLLPPVASGISHVDFVKQRLTQILQGAISGRLSVRGRIIVLLLAMGLLPLLPTFARPSAQESTADKETTAATKPDDKSKTDLSKPALPAPQPPDLSGGVPMDFEPRPQSLQFEPLHMRAMALSPDQTLLATGHGNWTMSGAVRIRNLKTGKDIATFHEPRGIASVKFSPDGKLLASSSWNRTIFIREVGSFKVLHEIPTGSVARIAFSPDGKTLAAVTENAQLMLFETATGKVKPALEGTFFRMQDVAFSPDGQFLAVGGGKFENPQNGRVAVWNLKTRKQIKVFDDISNPVISVAFSTDSRKLAAAGFDSLVHIWNLPDLKPLFTLRGHTNYIERAVFSPDGKRLFSAGHDRTAIVWDTFTGKRITSFGHADSVLCGVFTADGKRLFTGGSDKVVHEWDLATERELSSYTPGQDTAEFPEPVLAVAYSPDGSDVASAHEDKTIRIRDAVSGEIQRVLKGHDDVVSHIAYSPDGKQIASASYDKTVRLWNAADGTALKTLAGHTNWVFSVAFSPDGKQLASCGYDKTVRLWNPTDGKNVAVLEGHSATVRSVAFSPDGKQLVSGAGDRTAKLWNVATRKEIKTLSGHQGTLRAVAFSPDGHNVATAAEDKTVRIWQVATGEKKHELTHTGMVWSLAYSPGGEILATAGFDNMVSIWDPATGRRRMQLSGHTDVITSLAFSPDMKGLISGSYDRTLRFWRTKQSPISEMLTIAVSPDGVRDVKFSRDGRLMAAAGHDEFVKVWETTTGKLRHVLRGHTGGIRTIAFSPDGRMLATGSWDKTIQLWNLETGEHVGSLVAEKNDPMVVKFLPDGNTLVSASRDGVVRLWNVETHKVTYSFPAIKHPIVDVDVSFDGRYLMFCAGDYKKSKDGGEIQAWDLKSKTKIISEVTKTHCRNGMFHPDGKRFVVTFGNGRNTLNFWDVTTRQKWTLPASGSAARLDFLPAGKTLATTIGFNIVLLDLDGQREIGRFTGHSKTIYNITSSPDGSLLASVSQDGTIKLWPLRRRPTLLSTMSIAAHKGTSRFVIETRDGNRLITGGHDNLVKIWDRKTGKLLHTFAGHKGGVTCGALSPDGSLLATGSWDKTIRFWNVDTMKPVDTVLKNGAELAALQFSKDGKQLTSSGRGNVIRLWDIAAGKPVMQSVKQGKPVVNFDISPDGKLLVGVLSDWKTPREASDVKLWSAPDLKEIGTLVSHKLETKTAVFSKDGKRILVGGSGGLLAVFDAATRKLLRDLETDSGVMDAAFLGDGEFVASAEWSGLVTVWDPESRHRMAAGTEHNKFALRVVGSRDRSQLFSTGDDGTVRIWEMPQADPSMLGRVRRWPSPRNMPRISSISTRLVGETETAIHAAATSADFKLFAVGDDAGEVRLYNNASFGLLKKLNGHAGRVNAVKFSPDGKLLATGGTDKTVRVWETATGKSKLVLKEHEAKVNALLFTPDGKQIISADGLGDIRLWDAATGKLEVKFRSIEAGLVTLAISRDGQLLATGGWSKNIDLWRIRDRRLLATLKGHTSRVTALAFSPDGRTLVSGDASSADGKIVRLWDVKSAMLRTVANGMTKNVLAIRFAPRGDTFITTGEDRTLKLWDLETAQLLSSTPGQHERPIHTLDWSTDGKQLMTGSSNPDARLWSFQTVRQRWMPGFTSVVSTAAPYRLERQLTRHNKAAWFVKFSPDGSRLATGGQDRVVRIWEAKTWKLLREFKGHEGDVMAAAFSPDGTSLASAAADGLIKLWSLETGKPTGELKGHKFRIRKLLFLPDGKRIVSAGGDGTVRIWDVASGRQLHSASLEAPLYALALSPDGKSLAIGGGDWKKHSNGVVTIIDTSTGKPVKKIAATSGLIWALTYLPNGQLVVANGGGAGAAVWDVKTERRLRVLHLPRDVRSLRTSRDGKTVTIGYGSEKQGWVGIWNTKTGAPISRFQVGEVFLFDATSTQDGRNVLTATKDGRVNLWSRVEETASK